ncbi:beta-galactosidase [Opitutales bacterium ASA1]|uniref:glycoside hydrolase family 2 protein n=1 Tax=Congregicoccus parvus TaxID=3081749 RepID=UPI002B299EA1|nr:beta-galactosidase [Opitutales bacterium ASA1]
MQQRLPLDRAWRFRWIATADAETLSADAREWSEVDLPHGAFTPDLDGLVHPCGICEYTKTIELPVEHEGVVALFVGAAMHSAEVVVDGRVVARHSGGYLPFEVDLTDAARGRAAVDVTLRLDNRETSDVPPGKPLRELDFCWYGGLYRGVELHLRPWVHVTDPVAAGEVAGGGVFVRTLALDPDRAELSVRTHVRNAGAQSFAGRVRVEFVHEARVMGEANVSLSLDAGSSTHVETTCVLCNPRTWSPERPALHHARVTVLDADGGVLDCVTERFGIRRIAFSRAGGFTINGRRVRLRGTNRHQEYPYVGYAVPAAAQRRDARRIKEAGFDYVRLSHYPQSPHFLDACDELGIVVMNAIPGWQFMGGDAFREACERNARDLIRRDRNHPCVVLWELSLNETEMDDAFVECMNRIGHEELPGDQMYTCGWMDRFDVFVHARQHGRIHTWENGDKALVVSEYGDWEFYASNAGFDQTTGAGVLARWSNSRHFRGGGERGLRQQACNHALALGDTMKSPAVLDGQWAVFDHARGYDPTRAAVGVMDVFRLPKFSYWFYRSQRHAHEGGENWTGGPVVFIASHWTEASELQVLVFGNVDEVELHVNGRSLGRARPSRAWMWQHLPHPPFVYELPRFESGKLEAFGFVEDRLVATHVTSTPGPGCALEWFVDDFGIGAAENESDLLLAHVRVVDEQGTLCVGAARTIRCSIEGAAAIVGPESVITEAGVASFVVRVEAGCVEFALVAEDVEGTAGVVSTKWSHPTIRRIEQEVR